MIEGRSDFLPKPSDTDRDPANIDFSRPETANWAEISEAIEADPGLRSDIADSLSGAIQKNADSPNRIKIIQRIGLAIGIIGLGLGAKYVAENYELPDNLSKPDITNSMTPEAKAIQERDLQDEATAFHKEQTAIEADAEKEIYVAEPPAPNEIKDAPVPD